MKLDQETVQSLRHTVIDWRFKGLPADAFGKTIDDFLAGRPKLCDSGFVGPVLTLDNAALEHNLSTMASWCEERGVQLAPHGKTTMAPQLFQRQLDHGAWGITAANLSQIRVYRAFGVRRILLANELVDPHGLRWLAGELERDADFEFTGWVDSVDGVELMTEALRGQQLARPVDVLLELGGWGGRAGVRTPADAMRVAEAVSHSPALRLVGVGGYEGALAHGTTTNALSDVDVYLTALRDHTSQLSRAGYFNDVEEIIVTCGGSAYFDQVVEALTAPWPDGLTVLPVLRSGCYITHDDGLYREVSPFGRSHRLTGLEQPFRPAMRVFAQISSRPESGLALLTMGRRDVSHDQGFPVPQGIRDSRGYMRKLTGTSVTALADQHAFLTIDEDAQPADELRVGRWMSFGLSHPCTAFDKWPLIPVVDGNEVIDLVRTFF